MLSGLYLLIFLLLPLLLDCNNQCTPTGVAYEICLVYSFIHSFIYSFIHSFIHLFHAEFCFTLYGVNTKSSSSRLLLIFEQCVQIVHEMLRNS